MTEACRTGNEVAARRVMNLSHLLRQSARRHQDNIGLVWGERSWTWSDIDGRVDAAAVALTAVGVMKGDRVLVLSRNSNQMIESMFACFRIGAIWVPANFRQTPLEIAYLAQASGAKMFIFEAEFEGHANACRDTAPSVQHFIQIGPSPTGLDFDCLVANNLGRGVATAKVQHDDPCWFFFTSGSTGRPKAAVLTHGQMGFVVANNLCDLMPGTTEEDASLVMAPLSHGAGVHFLAQVARGAKSILPAASRFDAAEAWGLVQRWRVSNMFTVPTILKMLVESPAAETCDHTSLRYVIYAGAPMYREDQKLALTTLGKVIVQYFGLGEVTGTITVLPAELHDASDGPGTRIGTCGYERTGMQISIQGEAGQELDAGQMGEICVCGLAMFAGYYNNAEANAKAFRDGWFRTGDLGYMDQEGFLFITGRMSDMYISGGSNVYPREVEEKMLKHPAVAEVAIIGVPDEVWGEVGVAACVLRAGVIVDEAILLAWMADKVARYKLPASIVCVDSLPKSGYGKVTKKEVRELLTSLGHLPLVRMRPHAQ